MNIPRMNYRQYRKARRLTHECCNYCDGNCLLLDEWRGMCLCAEHFLFRAVPMVSGRCPPAGRDTSCRTDGAKLSCGVAGNAGHCFLPDVQTASTVQTVPRNASARARSCGQGNTGSMRRKSNGEKALKYQGFFLWSEGWVLCYYLFSWKRHLLFSAKVIPISRSHFCVAILFLFPMAFPTIIYP